jgi:hypothetical protein
MSKQQRHKQSCYSIHNLPSEVLAAVLGQYSCGKTISTFLLVAYGDHTLRSTAYSICRGGLVQRYIELSTNTRILNTKNASDPVEIRDVLDVIREDIRLSNDDDDQIMCQFSHWCAILDYFETQLNVRVGVKQSKPSCPQWIVWSGQLEIPYGIVSAFLTTPDWSVCALQYWRNQEVSQLNLTHPRNTEFAFIADDQIPYGTLFGMEKVDRLRFERQCSDLEVHILRNTTSSQRFTLVPLHESYDESPHSVFVDHSFVCRTHAAYALNSPLLIATGRQSLCCCWDKDMCEDLWDDAISNFGEHAIRIMQSFNDDFTNGTLNELYKNCNEFNNQV